MKKKMFHHFSSADTNCKSCTLCPGPSDPPSANADLNSLSDPTCPWVYNTGYYLNNSTKRCVECTTTSTGLLRAAPLVRTEHNMLMEELLMVSV